MDTRTDCAEPSSENDSVDLSKAMTGASSTDEILKLSETEEVIPLLIEKVKDPGPNLSAIGVMLTLHPDPEAEGVVAETKDLELTLT